MDRFDQQHQNFLDKLIEELPNADSKQSDSNNFDLFDSENLKRKSEIDPHSLHKEVEAEKESKKQDEFQAIRKISRKTSDDIIKLIEQMPEEHIHDLLQKIQTMNSPNLPIRLNVSKLLQKDLTQFSLNEDSNAEQDPDENKDISQNAEKEKKRKKRESKEKKCPCCGLLVKRHQCKHSTCPKPCVVQDRSIKSKEKKIE